MLSLLGAKLRNMFPDGVGPGRAVRACAHIPFLSELVVAQAGSHADMTFAPLNDWR
jgi:hypothetical protein